LIQTSLSSGRSVVDAQQVEPGLLAVLDLHGEGRVIEPVDAGEVLPAVAEVAPTRLAAVDAHDAQSHLGVGGAGERVAVVLLRALADRVAALVDDAVDRDVRLVDLGEGEAPAVGRPPEPVAATHLLLGDELGEAVGAPGAARAGRDLAHRAVGERRDAQLVVAHERDHRPVGRELRVEDRSGLVVGRHREAVLERRRVEHVEPVRSRHEQPVDAALGPRRRRDALAEVAGPLAAEPFLDGEVLLGDAAARGEGRAPLTGVEVEDEQVAPQRVLGAPEERQPPPAGAEADAGRDVVAGGRVAGDVVGPQAARLSQAADGRSRARGPTPAKPRRRRRPRVACR
jgi:hypothetical protein